MAQIPRHRALSRYAKVSSRLIARNLARVAQALCFFVTIFAAPAVFADPSVPAPPIYSVVDANNVDLLSGGVAFSENALAVGSPQQGGLSLSRYYVAGDSSGFGWRTNFDGTINDKGGGCLVVSLGGSSDDCNTMAANGSTLVNMGAGIYRYTTRDGTVADFDTQWAGLVPTQAGVARVTTLTYPNGEQLSFTYQISGTTCIGPPPCVVTNVVVIHSVRSNTGYQVQINQATGYGTGINLTVDYCDPAANTCTGLTAPVQSDYDLGRAPTFTAAHYVSPTGVTINYTYTGSQVTQASNGAETWTYAYSDASGTRTTTASLGGVVRRRVTSDIATGHVLTDTVDPSGLNRTTTIDWVSNRIYRIHRPEGDYTQYTYDSRGNVTETRIVSKTPGTPADIVTTASYPSTCDSTNFRICNKPTYTQDAVEQGTSVRTDYTYDAAHGGVLTVTLPADANGVRPQTRYSYTLRTARYKNSSGTIVDAPSSVYLLTGVSTCASGTAPSCVGTANETKTTITYGVNSSGVANNLLPTATTTAAGDNSVSATTASAYDTAGNVISVDGPLSGSDDTSYFRYDASRWQVGVISPDPDGAGSLSRRATRTTYNASGQVTEVEQGKIANATDTTWDTTFTPQVQQINAYDAQGRPSQTTSQIGGVTQQIVQYSYDGVGRPDCTALRMNPAVFGTIGSTSACTLGAQGSNGPDRITKNNYDNANEVTSVYNAYGTIAQITEATTAYTQNGKVDWIEDANGNRSDYTYDGFDRVTKLQFPSSTTPHTANGSDYETYAYDANSNVTSVTLRPDTTTGGTISFTYDQLNRLTLKHPSTGADVYFGYDLFGRQLYARFTSSSGVGVEHTYDALSRMLTEKDTNTSPYPNRTLTSAYDAAGRRTGLTYPDGFAVTYNYDLLNRMTSVLDTTSTSALVTYAYDDSARLSSLTRSNGTASTLSYVANSMNWSLAQSFPSSAYNLTLDYTTSASGQTLTRTPTTSLSGYKYVPPQIGSSTYEPNGLNQYGKVGGVTYAYDPRGNLVGDGSRTFGYDLENHLTSVGGSASMSLTYDPLGRLRQIDSGAATTQLLYDGANLVMEYDSGNAIQRHYVFGQSVDEPLIWYQGSAPSSTNRNYLHTDELGSVVATSDNSGVATPYAYDSYGRPANDNWTGSRFRYTGQIALNEDGGVHLYYYKARVYDPVLGRFLQTDPIGYGDGLNLYAYADNDPANASDPLGLDCSPRPGDAPGTIYACGTQSHCDDGGSCNLDCRGGCYITFIDQPQLPSLTRINPVLTARPQQSRNVRSAAQMPICREGKDIDFANGSVIVGDNLIGYSAAAFVASTAAEIGEPETAEVDVPVQRASILGMRVGGIIYAGGALYLAANGRFGDIINDTIADRVGELAPIPPLTQFAEWWLSHQLDKLEQQAGIHLNACREPRAPQ